MASKRPSAERLKQILERQSRRRFGRDYQPAIRANRQEAPARSRPSVGYWRRIGRDIHCLSRNERIIATLAMHFPGLFDLHEEKMLSTEPCLHPFEGHPWASGLPLPAVMGTLDVAERLGCLSIHPMIQVRSPDNDPWMMQVPFPYIGDFLLFLNDELGSYLVNWTVKDKHSDFLNTQKRGRRRNPEEDAYRAWARHEIERVYYADIGIHTVRIAVSTDIDIHVAENLRRLFCLSAQPVALLDDQRQELSHLFNEALIRGIPPYDMYEAHLRRLAVTWQSAQRILAQDIWERRLRVDLFRPVLFDRSLRPEERDVFDVYGDWFRRPPCTLASN